MKRIFGVLIFLSFISTLVCASPFSDLPTEHWAAEAVQVLARKGIVEGYQDGTFNGDRAATRYEMAMIVARLLSYLEKEKPPVTKEDLDRINRLVQEYHQELVDMGIRVANVESRLNDLSKRVEAVQKIKLFFHSDNIASYQWVSNKGSNFVQAFDFTTGRPLAGNVSTGNFGRSLFATSVADLDISTSLSPEWEGGGRLSLYSSGFGPNEAGDPKSYWGVTPPYLNNWWTGFPGGLNSANLERIWVRYDPSNLEAVYGTYFLQATDGFVFKGEPNPTYYGPDYLPLWGMVTRGNLDVVHLPWISYESASAGIPNQSPYLTKALGENVRFDFGKTIASIDFLRVDNDVSSFPVIAPVITPLSNPFNLTSRFGTIVSFTGPQAEYTWGGKVEHRFSSTFKMTGEYAVSRYNPDTTGDLILHEPQTGHLWGVEASGTLGQQGRYTLQYLSVDPTYDPFVLGYPGDAFIRNFAIWNNLPNFYFLHDSLNYPDNRQGIKGFLQWDFGNSGLLSVFGSNLKQKVSTAVLGNIEPVYIEPVFITSPNAGFTTPYPFLSNNKGNELQFGGTFSSRLTRALKGVLSVSAVHLTRPNDPTIPNNVRAPGLRNDWDETFTTCSLNLNYAISSTLTGETGIGDVRLLGTQNGFPGYSINQVSWFAGFSYNLTQDAAAALQYRFFNTKEATPAYGAVYPFASEGPFFGNSQAAMILGRLFYHF